MENNIDMALVERIETDIFNLLDDYILKYDGNILGEITAATLSIYTEVLKEAIDQGAGEKVAVTATIEHFLRCFDIGVATNIEVVDNE